VKVFSHLQPHRAHFRVSYAGAALVLVLVDCRASHVRIDSHKGRIHLQLGDNIFEFVYCLLRDHQRPISRLLPRISNWYHDQHGRPSNPHFHQKLRGTPCRAKQKHPLLKRLMFVQVRERLLTPCQCGNLHVPPSPSRDSPKKNPHEFHSIAALTLSLPPFNGFLRNVGWFFFMPSCVTTQKLLAGCWRGPVESSPTPLPSCHHSVPDT
jgi:hypothetical protein